MRTILSLAVGAMALSAVAASAAEQTPPTSNERDVIICKRVPAATGTRLGSRVMCMKRAEWEQQAQEDRAEMEDAHRHGLAAKPPGS